MKSKIYIAFLFAFLMVGVASAMTVGTCTIIESGIYAGKTVCYAGTITVSAGEVTTFEVNVTTTEEGTVVNEIIVAEPVVEELASATIAEPAVEEEPIVDKKLKLCKVLKIHKRC